MTKIKEKKKIPAPTGRKRNPVLTDHILEATIDTLAAVGFDLMTMDEVAARSGSAKTTVYRRWPSKAELVRDALIWMSRASVNVDSVPDTGSLREDLLSVQKDYSAEFSKRKMQVLAGLGSFYSKHRAEADAVSTGVFEPMTQINLKILERAIERGEIPASADIELACQTIVATITYRTRIENQSFNKVHYAQLLDRLILPALRHS